MDYRYFDDDWGISAHTLDFAWHQNVGERSALIPFLRYYTQDQADFTDALKQSDCPQRSQPA